MMKMFQNTTISIVLLPLKLFAAFAFIVKDQKLTTAATVELPLERTIATFVTCGCRPRRILTTASNAASVVWEEKKISSIVLIVECALMPSSSMITIAKLESICLIAQSVRKIFSPQEVQVMRCHVVMPYIGIAFVS